MSRLAELSDGLVYAAIAVHALSMLAYTAASAQRIVAARTVGVAVPASGGGAPIIKSDPPPPRTLLASAIGSALAGLGTGLTVGAVLTRGLAAGRAPWGNMYEFALMAALAAGAAYLVLLRRRDVTALGPWLQALVVLTLGLAVTVLRTPVDGLVPVLDSAWLVVHVGAAIVAGGIFTVGFVATVLQLVRQRGDQRIATGRRARYAATLPEARVLDRIAHAAHVAAFPLWTFAVIAGAIWAENAWGRYWGWDPKETWAFITWVMYAAALHAHATPGWRGTRASWLAMAGYAAFLFNFVGVNVWLPGLHSYAGV